MKGRMVVRISPADVGRRVSVRARVVDHGAEAMTDTVGRLLSWDGDTLRIERRDGTVATVDAAALLAGRVIPERP